MKTSVSAVLAALVAWTALSTTAQAQEFPDRPITIILNSSPGSGVDAMARTLAGAAEREFGQSVVVTNRPGGDGAIAMSELLRSPANGYLVWGATKTFPVSMNTTLQGQFQLEDFQPLVRAEIDPFAVVVRSDSPWVTLDDMLEAARERPVNSGGFGSSSPHGLFNFRLMSMTDTELRWIPFNASGEATAALLGGHIDVVVSNPSVVRQQVEAGLMRILAVATEERVPEFPDLPTFTELGYDVVDYQWRGLFLRAGTPQEIVKRLDTGFRAAVASETFQSYLATAGQIDGSIPAAEFEVFVRAEFEEVTAVASEFRAYLE